MSSTWWPIVSALMLLFVEKCFPVLPSPFSSAAVYQTYARVDLSPPPPAVSCGINLTAIERERTRLPQTLFLCSPLVEGGCGDDGFHEKNFSAFITRPIRNHEREHESVWPPKLPKIAVERQGRGKLTRTDSRRSCTTFVRCSKAKTGGPPPRQQTFTVQLGIQSHRPKQVTTHRPQSGHSEE